MQAAGLLELTGRPPTSNLRRPRRASGCSAINCQAMAHRSVRWSRVPLVTSVWVVARRASGPAARVLMAPAAITARPVDASNRDPRRSTKSREGERER